MGTYCYTMRKRQVNFTLPSGERVKGNLFDYSYKPSYSFMPSAEYTRFVNGKEAAAERAYETYEGGYVVCGDLDNGIASLEGAVVYTDVKSCRWLDSGPFPGTAVGYITVRGKRAYLVRSLPWYKHRGTEDREFRSTIKDGKAVTEGRFTDDHTPIILGETVNERGERIREAVRADGRERDSGCDTCLI